MTGPETSSTLPCWSTARHRYRSQPLIPTNTSSRCHLSPGGGRRRHSGWRSPPELGAPPPNRLLTHRDTADEHQLLDLTEAKREPEGQPHAAIDDLDRVTVTLLRRRCGAHPTNPPRSPTTHQRDSAGTGFRRVNEVAKPQGAARGSKGRP